MEPARDAKIGPTAHYTAYVWHRLGMPHAEHFVTSRGRRLFWTLRLAGEWMAAASPRVPSMQDYLEFRHRTIDAILDQYQPDRLVEIGAGLSRRGITWAADRGVRTVEIDLPHMASAKRQLVSRLPSGLRDQLSETWESREGDILAPGFGAQLAEILQGADRAAVIAEGVINYFEPPERRAIGWGVCEGLRAAGRGIFLCDLRTGADGARLRLPVRAIKLAIKAVTRGRGLGRDFVDDADVRCYFRECGFPESVAHGPDREVPVRHLPSKVWEARVGSPQA